MRLFALFFLATLLALAQPREATCTVTDNGGDDAYVGSCPSGTIAVRLIAATANTGPTTLDIGGGAIAIKHGGSTDPANGAIPGGAKLVRLSFDGTYWQIESSGGGGGGASSVTGFYSGTLDFGSIPDGGTAQLTFAATGLAANAVLAFAPPSGLEAGLTGMAIASATDTVTIRLHNGSGAAVDPASATFAVRDMTNLGYISASGTINFAEIPDGGCASNTFTATGAATGDNAAPGWPSGLEAGLVGAMFVSATDTVTARLCNWSGAAVDPASATFKVGITK